MVVTRGEVHRVVRDAAVAATAGHRAVVAHVVLRKLTVVTVGLACLARLTVAIIIGNATCARLGLAIRLARGGNIVLVHGERVRNGVENAIHQVVLFLVNESDTGIRTAAGCGGGGPVRLFPLATAPKLMVVVNGAGSIRDRSAFRARRGNSFGRG